MMYRMYVYAFSANLNLLYDPLSLRNEEELNKQEDCEASDLTHY